MNILQISYADIKGGAEKIAFNLFQQLPQYNHQSNMCTGNKFSNDKNIYHLDNNKYLNLWGKTFKTIENLSNENHVRFIPWLARWLGYLNTPEKLLNYYYGKENFIYPATQELFTFIEKKQVDLIHAHNLHGDYFDLRQLPQLSNNTPILFTLHDMWLLTGHCAHSFNCQRWQIGCGQCPDLSIYPTINQDSTQYNWQKKSQIINQTNAYFAIPSKWLANIVRSSYLNKHSNRTKIIYNGIDTHIFKPTDKLQARERLNLPKDLTIILFSSNQTKNNPFKDYKTINDAVQILIHKKRKKLCFLALGERGKNQHINETSWLLYREYESNPSQVALYYSAADIYVHAAKAEVFGLSITEAMACGLPITATNVGGISEQVIDNHNGFLTPPADPTALANAIEKLLENITLQKKFGENSKAKVKDKFTLEIMIKNYISFYEEIIEIESRP